MDRYSSYLFAYVGRNIGGVLAGEQARDSLRNQEIFLRGILDALPTHIFLLDREGHYVLVNRPFAAWFNMSPQEVVGKTLEDLVGRNAMAVQRHYEDLGIFSSGKHHLIPEARYESQEGEAHWFRIEKRPLYDRQGNISYVLATSTDISERVLAERALAKSAICCVR